MAWPSEAGAIAAGVQSPAVTPNPVSDAVIVPIMYRTPFVEFCYSLIPADMIPDDVIGDAEFHIVHGRGKYYHTARSKFRIFNAAEYRFYWSTDGPPEEGSTPDATRT